MYLSPTTHAIQGEIWIVLLYSMVCHSRWPVDVTPTWNQRLPYSSISEFNLGISIKISLGGENSRPAVPAYRPFRFFYFCLITLAFKCVFCKWGNGPLMHQEWSPWSMQKTRRWRNKHFIVHDLGLLLLSTKTAKACVQQTADQVHDHWARGRALTKTWSKSQAPLPHESHFLAFGMKSQRRDIAHVRT